MARPLLRLHAGKEQSMRGRTELSWVVSLCAAVSSGACASSSAAPAAISPASPRAPEAPLRPVATSLAHDPLEQEPPEPAESSHAHHHHHDAPAPAAQAAQPPDGGVPSETTEYVCPMHPDVRQPKPGRCPRCGMTLVPKPMGGPGPKPQSEAEHEHAH